MLLLMVSCEEKFEDHIQSNLQDLAMEPGLFRRTVGAEKPRRM